MARNEGLSLTRQLAHQLVAQDIRARSTERAAYFLLDTLANMLAGSATAPGEMLGDWLRAEAPSPERSAFAMAGMAHVLELDDLHRGSVTHPGCVVIPAAIAIARRREVGPGALLNAIVRGYEAVIRVGESVGPEHYRRFHNTATCGPFGSAAAVASLRGLGEDGYTTAFGSAGTTAGGLWQFNVEGAMSKHLHAAHAARSGLVAAELAALGLTAPEQILEGERGFHATLCADARPKAVTAPNRDWKIVETSIKPWPTCRHTHPAIDAALRLAAQVHPTRIQGIVVSTYPAAIDVCDRPDPVNAYQAGFSLQHVVATTLALGAVGPQEIGERSLREPAVKRLVPKVSLEVHAAYAENYPRRWQSAVTVTLDDGTTHTEEALAAKGDPEAPLSWEELARKAETLLGRIGWNGERSAKLAEAVQGLPGARDDRQLAVIWEALDEHLFRTAKPAASTQQAPAAETVPAAEVLPEVKAVPEVDLATEVIALAAPLEEPAHEAEPHRAAPTRRAARARPPEPQPQASKPTTARGEELFRDARAAHEARRFPEAEGAYQQAIDIFYQQGEMRLDADATQQLARLKHQTGAHDISHQLYTRALALYRTVEDPRAEAELLRFIGILARDRGKLDEAEQAFADATRIFDETRDPEQQAATLYLSSLVAKERGNATTASKLLGDAKRIYSGAVPS